MKNIFSSTRLARHASVSRPSTVLSLATLPLAILAAATLLASQGSAQARLSQARSSRDVAMAENGDLGSMSLSQAMTRPMRERRVLMLLPARVGDGWKAMPEFTSAFLRQIDLKLRSALSNTNRYSLLEVRRFSPILMRAVQDGVATSGDLNILLNQPTTPNASVFLSKLTFNKAPQQVFVEPAVIASFVLDNFSTSDNSLSVKLTGRLYSADGKTVLRSLSANTTAPYSTTGGAVLDAAASSGAVSLDRVLGEFMRIPTENEMLTGQKAVAENVGAPVVAPPVLTPVLPPVTTASGTVLPGKPIRDSSSNMGGMPAASGTNEAPVQPTIGVSTTVETPAAEIFPAPLVIPETKVPATTDAPPTGASTPDAAASAIDTTTATDDLTPDTSAPSDMAGDAAPATDAATDTSDTSPPAASSDGTKTVNPTPTDGTADTGITSDGTSSAGTVGLSSTETHATKRPPIDDDLGFEY